MTIRQRFILERDLQRVHIRVSDASDRLVLVADIIIGLMLARGGWTAARNTARGG